MKSFNKRRTYLLILLLLLVAPIYAQTVRLDVSSLPLNKVLLDLRDTYKLHLSFNDKDLSSYLVTVNGNFETVDDAIAALIKGLDLDFEKRADTYIIYPKKNFKKRRSFNISGQVVDIMSLEALPFSHVMINGHGAVSDFKGNFSYISQTDSIFSIRVSYLGYFVLDTVLAAANRILLPLLPASIDIDEVVITGSVIEHSVQAGNNAGETRLNHEVSGYLPGNGDNSVFNLLRLQPGILAAGEQSSDLIIWGSYEGHSKVVFDGFTIFGLRNYNDNISAVNPYLAKDIKVLKGGFGAEYGERVGGIVDITGIDGSTLDPHVNFSINNMTLNGMVSVPLFKQSSMLLAFRQTYYDLNDAVNLNLLSSRNNSNQRPDVDVNVYPDYLFRDLNFKYSGRFNNGDTYFFSFYSGGDNFSYSTEDAINNITVFNDAEEVNFQKGMSAFYGKKWKNGAVSNMTIAYSGLNNEMSEFREVILRRPGMQDDEVKFSRDIKSETSIDELDIHLDNYLAVTDRHTLKFGLGTIKDNLSFKEDTFDVEHVNTQSDLLLFNSYVTDVISISKNFSLELGLRADYSPDLEKAYIQPRVSANIKLGERMKINGAWGMYNQFIARSSIVDESGNFRYQWTVCDNESVPVLSAEHLVGGISYSFDGLLISLEGFKKKTDGLTRYVRTKNFRRIFYGDSRSKGMDLFVKKQFSNHTAWVSYSLSKTEEFFPYTEDSYYMPALHDQRHEIKLASILSFDPFYLSSNYVYGSGFPRLSNLVEEETSKISYSRLDASLVYKFKRKTYFFDAGLSVLNIFNTENIKFSNFVRIPSNLSGSVNIHAEAVPRTFTIFLNLSF